MVLAYKQTHRPKEQRRKPRYKATPLQCSRKASMTPIEGSTISSINHAGKLDAHTQKNETRPLSLTTHKNQFQMKYLNINLKTLEVLEENAF